MKVTEARTFVVRRGVMHLLDAEPHLPPPVRDSAPNAASRAAVLASHPERPDA